MYTVEQIRKAKRFRLTNNKHFDSDTKVDKWYELNKDFEGAVYHVDDVGYRVWHARANGILSLYAELSIRDGYIEYDIPGEVKMQMVTKQQIGESNYLLVLRTNKEGLDEIEANCERTGKASEIRKLEQEKESIEQRIAELKGCFLQ